MYYSRKKKFKKVFIVTTIFAAVAFFCVSLLLNKSPESEVVAKINGEEIYKSEVETKLHDIFDSNSQNVKTPEIKSLPKEVLEILVKDIYLERELTKQAEKSEVAKDQEVIDSIAYAKNKILRQSYVENLIKNAVTDEKINEKYLEISNNLEGKKEYSLSHIVVKTKEEAEKILSEIKSAKSEDAKFNELAKKHSIDKNTADKGG
ncbi:MAG: SurA N-terminal domain-containing protein, partial [Rickettsiales bacterium]|nr:SurA N-terminal domain-containing protein [Rickettsiales bacterium]